MEAAFVDTSARLRVGFICAANDVQPQGSLLETGFAVTKAEAQTLVDTVAARLGEADLVIIGGSVPHPSIAWCYAAILDACASAQTPCWVDSYGPGMTAALDAATPPALAKPNRQELPTTEAWERCGELHISDGPGALEIHRGDERWQVRPPVVDEVNPVGSGDCYVAGLAHGRLSGLDFADQLRWAAAAGAANAARWDVAQISAGDAEPLLPHVVVEAGAAP
jgi:fructose-1-phosphate kinase PfkB-like protein